MMKSNIYTIVGTLVSVFILVACGNKGGYSSYQDACAKYDFEAAYAMIEKDKNDYESKDIEYRMMHNFDYESAKIYIFEKEANYLLEQKNEQSTQRLLFLVKEQASDCSKSDGEWYDLFKQKVDKIMTLALMTENVDFLAGMIKQYPPKDYYSNLSEEFSVFEFLAKANNSKANDAIISFYKAKIAMTKGGENFPREGVIMTDPYANSESLHNDYVKDVENYNNTLDRLLDISISANNSELANMLVNSIEPVPCIWAKGKKCVFSNNAQVQAKKKLGIN